MSEFIKSTDCKEVILIGETSIYDKIKNFLKMEEKKYLISYFRSDNTYKTVFCEQKKNKQQSYFTSIYEELISLTEPTFIINCGCYYIYPRELLYKKNLTLINFHNGLLPIYRGLNIPSWVIYNEEKEGGITWHIIREKVDTGEALKRGTISVGCDERAYQLCNRLFVLGYNLFLELWHDWEDGILNSVDMQNINGTKRYFYYEKDIPNNGVIDLRKDKVKTIYNTLRAVDYGKFCQFPPVILIDRNGKHFIVYRYWINNDHERREIEEKKIIKLELENTFLYIEIIEK